MRWEYNKSTTSSDLEEKYPRFYTEILEKRGITSIEELNNFIADDQKFYDPFLIRNIDKAVNRIFNAQENSEKIVIYGDYDVDGITATSLLWDFLYRELNLNVMPYIPSRFEEGYGMNDNALQGFLDDNVDLVITVDCGIRDIELTKKFKEKGLDFIITDHHSFPVNEKGEKIENIEVSAVVHPDSPESEYPFKSICGAAVAWKFVCALSEKLKPDFNPNKYLDLVSLATVTDIMPLIDENRLILKKGLKQFRNSENNGINSLVYVSDYEKSETNVYHYGFVIGPKLNAAGRIDHALDAVRLLTTNSTDSSDKYASKLFELNLIRQKQTQEMLESARSKVEDPEKKVHFIVGEDWSEGIVGLVAGKLQEELYRPLFVGTLNDGIVTGSARSIGGFNVTEALASVGELLIRFGGHAQAAGFSFEEKYLEKVIEGIEKYAEAQIDESMLEKVLIIDTEIESKDLNLNSVDLIDSLEPFGYKNKRPVILIEKCRIKDKRFIGRENNHVKLRLQKDLEEFDCIAFNFAERFIDYNLGDIIDVVGSLEKNVWNGNTNLQFKLTDFKIHE